ncbi:MAG: GNAT family N-acetyltransferase [Theionarchaea archaeon]|nr:GNAT family N-acetyltransferase [Theionarchaea archaeon]MBU7036960.1 GNAT family N-acetyltransferase [Theionarchaea archaeon]
MQNIEEFTEEDAEELEDLFTKVWSCAHEYPEAWRERRKISSQKVKQEMQSGFRFFGARDRGKIVGCYKLLITEEGCFGEHQSILPDYVGQGIASAMYSQFIQFAHDQHCRKNYVNILTSHRGCLRLVEKYGFSKKGPVFEQAPGMTVQKYERWCHE